VWAGAAKEGHERDDQDKKESQASLTPTSISAARHRPVAEIHCRRSAHWTGDRTGIDRSR
jgi:hypothetical protein